MAVTKIDLRKLVGVSTTEATDADLEGYLTLATAMVDKFVADDLAEVPPVFIPAAAMDRAYLLVAAELFGQDQAPNGVLNQQYETETGPVATPVRISSDPLRPAYGVLSLWVSPVTIA